MLFCNIQQHSDAIQNILSGAFYDRQNISRTMPDAAKIGQKPYLNADFADLKKRKNKNQEHTDSSTQEFKNNPKASKAYPKVIRSHQKCSKGHQKSSKAFQKSSGFYAMFGVSCFKTRI